MAPPKREPSQLEYVHPSVLHPYEGNPRRISEAGLQALRRSIREFGWTNPVLAQRGSGMVIAGHQRLKAALAEGIDRIPVVYLDMDDLEAKAYLIADNRLQDESEWVDDQLDALLGELREAGFDTTLTGFTEGELDALLGPEAEPAGADDVPVVAPGPTATRLGDLWLLGDHRLLCGSSAEAADVDRLMDGAVASLCATDPPYGIAYRGISHPTRNKDWGEVYHEADVEEDGAVPLWEAAFGHARRVVSEDAGWYCWHADRRRAELVAVWRKLGLLVHQTVIWVKPIGVLNFQYFMGQHEPCLFGWVEGNRPRQPKAENRTTIWRAGWDRNRGEEAVSDVWEASWDGKAHPPRDIDHPCVKPTEVYRIPIRLHTKPGDVCYEPFSGSGTQIIAAQDLGRRCYAMELDPYFVDVTLARWVARTGKQPVRENDGMTFEAARAAALAEAPAPAP